VHDALRPDDFAAKSLSDALVPQADAQDRDALSHVSAAAALEEYGADLFIKEDTKRDLGKDKIPAKIFEIERRLLIRRRPR
jgi:hypothetical protein